MEASLVLLIFSTLGAVAVASFMAGWLWGYEFRIKQERQWEQERRRKERGDS